MESIKNLSEYEDFAFEAEILPRECADFNRYFWILTRNIDVRERNARAPVGNCTIQYETFGFQLRRLNVPRRKM